MVCVCVCVFPPFFFLLPCTPLSTPSISFFFLPSFPFLSRLIFGPAQASNLFLFSPSFYPLPSSFFHSLIIFTISLQLFPFVFSFFFLLLHGVEVSKICMNGNHPSLLLFLYLAQAALCCLQPLLAEVLFLPLSFFPSTSYKHMAYAIFCFPSLVQCGTYPLLTRAQSTLLLLDILFPSFPPPPLLTALPPRSKNRLCIKITNKKTNIHQACSLFVLLFCVPTPSCTLLAFLSPSNQLPGESFFSCWLALLFVSCALVLP